MVEPLLMGWAFRFLLSFRTFFPVPVLQSEVELEDVVVDLLMGPADERQTSTHHAMHAEEEQILG